MDMQDRISHLPDYLLHDILSLLDTTQVVQTCVLSKRWKTLWTHIPTLNFDYSSFPFKGLRPPSQSYMLYIEKGRSFRGFIFRVLDQHRSECIKKLSYSHPIYFEKGFVTQFLFDAQCYNVQELDITTYDAHESMLSCLSTFKLLTMLKITCRHVRDLASLVLPCLRILEIKRQWNCDWDNPYDSDDDDDLCYEDVQLNENTFSGCPNLERLVLFDCVSRYGNCIIISAPKLENLEFIDSLIGLTLLEVELWTPNLKTVELCNVIPCVKSPYDFAFINKVSLGISRNDHGREHPLQELMEESISQLLRVFHNLVSLTLPPNATQVIFKHPSLSGCSFPNLRCLKEFKTYGSKETIRVPQTQSPIS